MSEADIGLIGLAVMGQNLVLNMDDHGYIVAVYNRTQDTVESFLKGSAKGTKVVGSHSIEDFVGKLKRPRKVMLMIKAGAPVDAVIDQLTGILEKGDIIIDGGNSNYVDSNRRYETLKKAGLLYIGAGISGGEEGARYGPSIMPGGDPDAWPAVKDIFQKIAAKVDNEPCCEWVGDAGAGHFVKMVHNGIEYGDMQLICEAYHMLNRGLGLNTDELGKVFSEWNKGELDSYLIEITAKIFAVKDDDGKPLVDKILDVAGQKGTGKWTGINALELGIPLTLVAESVFSRFLSSMKEERIQAEAFLGSEKEVFKGDKTAFIDDVAKALYASKIVSYAQGFMLMKQAALEYGWNLNYGAIALMWRGGCIIRSHFLSDIKKAFDKASDLTNLLLDQFFKDALHQADAAWRRVLQEGIGLKIPLPCMSSGLAFYDAYRMASLPQNLLQAQRDFFGAHTYERIDKKRGEFFHTAWS